MQPSCCIVNLSRQPAGWIPARILGLADSQLQHDQATTAAAAGCHAWRVSTKYFYADILLRTMDSAMLLEENSERLQPVIESTEAVVFYCDSTQESFQLACRAWERFKEVSPAICLCVMERTIDVSTDNCEISRAAVLEWCLARQFELVDCEEEGEENTDFEEKFGRDRIAEALKSHTWSNMTLLKDTPQNTAVIPETRPSENSDDVEGNKKNPQDVEKETESFESLFSQLSVMKEQSARLPPGDRKLYAEKMALAFYAAMGIEDGDSDED